MVRGKARWMRHSRKLCLFSGEFLTEARRIGSLDGMDHCIAIPFQYSQGDRIPLTYIQHGHLRLSTYGLGTHAATTELQSTHA